MQKVNESSWSVFALIRFILSVIVFVGHLHVFVHIPPILRYVELFGAKAAVLGFLLISGLSIGYSYNKNKEGYFSRRFLRIYPLYFFSVLFTILIQILVGSPYNIFSQVLLTAGWKTSIANFFFLQGFLAIPITYNGPLWSLAIEVFFYLLVPLLHKAPLMLINVFVILSLSLFNFWHKDSSLYGSQALIYAWPWLLGFLISKHQSLKYISILLFLGVMSSVHNKIISEQILGWLTFSCTSITLVMCTYTRVNLNLSKRIRAIFNYLGDISYPLYLFHFPFCILLHYLGIRNAWLFIIIALITMIPTNQILDKWFKKVFWKPILNTLFNKVNIL